MSGVVDEPILGRSKQVNNGSEEIGDIIKREDTLDLDPFAKALASFIGKTDTPITIGVQGTWGSGKTSLLNTVHRRLETEGSTMQVWVNAWEHSLMCGPEETLLNITHEIIQELTEADQNEDRKKKILASTKTIFKGAARFAVRGTSAYLGIKNGDEIDELFDKADSKSPIRVLRHELEELTESLAERSTTPIKKIVVYIDDLDRIEPRDAVRLLELLKNIFSLPYSVFVLAIDYDVVVKGLKDKFGERTADNDREFRAYFDKIIQLPFMMPTGSYSIGDYVGNLLDKIGYVDRKTYNADHYSTIIRHSVRGNPRSIKRLVNSLALISEYIEIQGRKKSTSKNIAKDVSQTLLFAVVCIQIAYPEVYEFLLGDPNFEHWDTTWAQRNGQSLVEDKNFKTDLEAVSMTEEFDEEWEQSLYRVTYKIPEYRGRARDVSRLLNYIKSEILVDCEEEQRSNAIADIIGATSVTSVSLGVDNSNTESQSGNLQKQFFEEVCRKLSERGRDELASKKPAPRNYFEVNSSIKDVIFSIKLMIKNGEISAGILWRAPQADELIERHKIDMKKAAENFIWEEKEGRTYNFFWQIKKDCDLKVKEGWDEYTDWVCDRIEEVADNVIPLLKE
jgi:hypothetical protein